jgi:peptidyl-tRNA hydrolase
VLSSFEPVEREELPGVVAEAVRAVESIAELGAAAAMNRVNVRAPQASADKNREK